MKHTWTIIGVSNVPRSFRWYQALFGQPETVPAHDYFGQNLDTDGTVLLCLHQWGAHEHPTLTSPENGTPGNELFVVLPRGRFRHDAEEGARRDRANHECQGEKRKPSPRMFAVQGEVSDTLAETFVFRAQKTVCGGKQIAKGDRTFLFASENEGAGRVSARRFGHVFLYHNGAQSLP